jgi:hypothetical protein
MHSTNNKYRNKGLCRNRYDEKLCFNCAKGSSKMYFDQKHIGENAKLQRKFNELIEKFSNNQEFLNFDKSLVEEEILAEHDKCKSCGIFLNTNVQFLQSYLLYMYYLYNKNSLGNWHREHHKIKKIRNVIIELEKILPSISACQNYIKMLYQIICQFKKNEYVNFRLEEIKNTTKKRITKKNKKYVLKLLGNIPFSKINSSDISGIYMQVFKKFYNSRLFNASKIFNNGKKISNSNELKSYDYTSQELNSLDLKEKEKENINSNPELAVEDNTIEQDDLETNKEYNDKSTQVNFLNEDEQIILDLKKIILGKDNYIQELINKQEFLIQIIEDRKKSFVTNRGIINLNQQYPQDTYTHPNSFQDSPKTFVPNRGNINLNQQSLQSNYTYQDSFQNSPNNFHNNMMNSNNQNYYPNTLYEDRRSPSQSSNQSYFSEEFQVNPPTPDNLSGQGINNLNDSNESFKSSWDRPLKRNTNPPPGFH